MNNKLKLKSCAFIFLSFLFACNSLASDESHILSDDDLMLVHATQIRPSLSEEGTLVLKTGGRIILYDNDDNVIGEDLTRPARISLHWAVNQLTQTAGQEEKGKFVYELPCSYIIMVPFRNLKDAVYGGSYDDVYTLGDYTLTENDIIIASSHDSEIALLKKSVKVIEVDIPMNTPHTNWESVLYQILKELQKPRILLSGYFLDLPLFGTLFNVPLEDLSAAYEEDGFNWAEKYFRGVTALIKYNDMPYYILKDVFRTNLPIAIIYTDNNSCHYLFDKELKDILGANYDLPDGDVLHSSSILFSFEGKIAETYKNKDPATRRKVTLELQTYVEMVLSQTQRTPPPGFYLVIQRILRTCALSNEEAKEPDVNKELVISSRRPKQISPHFELCKNNFLICFEILKEKFSFYREDTSTSPIQEEDGTLSSISNEESSFVSNLSDEENLPSLDEEVVKSLIVSFSHEESSWYNQILDDDQKGILNPDWLRTLPRLFLWVISPIVPAVRRHLVTP